MKYVYFILDLIYDGNQQVKILEGGSAFDSEYPTIPIGPDHKTAYEVLLEDLKEQYPNSLFLQVHSTGFDLIDLEKKEIIQAYDKKRLLVDSLLNGESPSFYDVQNLVKEILLHAELRESDSRPLILYFGRHIYNRLDMAGVSIPAQQKNLNVINHASLKLQNALVGKGILHEALQNNPLYPETLYLSGFGLFNFLDEQGKIEAFLKHTQSPFYILKPTNGTHSEHVHLVKAEEVLKVLKQIEKREYIVEACKHYLDSGFLLQVCHVSHKKPYRGQDYYCKGRVLLRADFKNLNEVPLLHLLTGYWQLAGAPVAMELSEATLISNFTVNPQGVVTMSPEELQHITKALQSHLPSVLKDLESQQYAWISQSKPFSKEGLGALAMEERAQYRAESLLQFSNALKAFYKTHRLIPADFHIFRKIYVWFNYIDDRNQQALCKQVFADLVGLGPQSQKRLQSPYLSVDHFIQEAIQGLAHPDMNHALPTISRRELYHYREQHVKQFCVYWLLTLLLLTGSDFIQSETIGKKSFVSTAIMAFFICLLVEIIRSAQACPPYFFSSASSQTAISGHQASSSDNNSDHFSASAHKRHIH